MGLRAELSAAFACLIACSCAAETQERPIEAPARSKAGASPAPLPPTAFTADDEHAEARAAPARPVEPRFATRRIGGEAPPARRFVGARVDLDLKGADLHDTFRLLADVGKVNIVVSGDVSGTVTIRMRRVPWDQALDVIVRARGLDYEREGNVILVRAAHPSAAR